MIRAPFARVRLSFHPAVRVRVGSARRLLVGPLESELLRSSFDLNRRGSAGVFEFELAQSFFELGRLPSHLFALIADRDRFEVLTRAYYKAARQQRSGYADRHK